MSNKSRKPDKNRKLFKDRNHLKWLDPKLQGLNGNELVEDNAVPDFFARSGDCVISPKTLERGKNNNTMIIMGRDRSGLGEIIDDTRVATESGFGHHMGAGAIDIVVGRMAPFPVASLKGDHLKDPLKFGPAFKTKEYPKGSAIRGVQIGNYKDTVITNPDGTSGIKNEHVSSWGHPGIVMDAARIYISQMTNLDDYFGIKKEIYVEGVKDDESKISNPHSGIMLKADEIRIHSRKDIKIVTGGINETYDSQGNSIDFMKKTGKIHLIAGNGLNPQHPVVLGNVLVELFDQFFKLFEDYANNVDTFMEKQIEFNASVAGHVHTELGATGMPSLPSLMCLKKGAETTYSQLVNNVIGGTLAVGCEMNRIRTYIQSASSPGRYINSTNVTTS